MVFIQLVMINSVIGPRRCSKALLKAELAPQKWSWSLVVGHDALQFSEFGESITSEKYAQQINEMNFKLQQKGPNSSLGQ